jgi:hypothetical protein
MLASFIHHFPTRTWVAFMSTNGQRQAYESMIFNIELWRIISYRDLYVISVGATGYRLSEPTLSSPFSYSQVVQPMGEYLPLPMVVIP